MSDAQSLLDDQKDGYERPADTAELDKKQEVELQGELLRRKDLIFAALGSDIDIVIETKAPRMVPIRSAISGNTAPMGLAVPTTARGAQVPGLRLRGPTTFYGGGPAIPIESQTQQVQPLREFDLLKEKVIRGGRLEAAGRIKGFRRLMERWGFTRKDAADILGFDDEGIIGELYAGIERVQQRDVRERLKLFLSLAVDLDGLYDDDGVIKEWLEQPKKLLRSKTPRQMLVEGSVESLLRVRQLVQYEGNR